LSPSELIATVNSLGGQIRPDGDHLKVDVPKGSLTPDLVEELKRGKPDLLEYLRLAESCRRIEEMQLAIKVVEKDGDQGWWLVASTARSEADDDAPVYQAAECIGIITSGLSHEEIRTLDRAVKPYKLVFGGEVLPKEEQK
jgi:hypothetical protein